MAGTLARALPDDYRLLLQHVRRCPQGSVRPQTAGWKRPLRHCENETQTRLALQTAQPLRLARSSLPNRVANPIQAQGLKASGRCLHNTRHLLFIWFPSEMEGCCGGPPFRHSGCACRFTISTSFSHLAPEGNVRTCSQQVLQERLAIGTVTRRKRTGKRRLFAK